MAYTKSLANIGKDEVSLAGQRAVDLAACSEQKIVEPEAFVLLSNAFADVVEQNSIRPKIEFLLNHLDKKSSHSLMNVYSSIRKITSSAKFPEALEKELKDLYESISAQGIGLGNKTLPVRMILSSNAPEDPENNDTVIQNIRDWNEFIVAVRESWALAFLPSQLGYRMMHKYNEKQLQLAILVQTMTPSSITVHTHSAMPEDSEKIYAEVYYGFPDLREKVKKDYYAITKNQLEIVMSHISAQPNKLVMKTGDLVLEQLPSQEKEDKLIKRDLQELARLTKKIERTVQAAVKCFFTYHNEQLTLQWVNRLPLFEERETPATVEVVDLDEPVPDVHIEPDEEDTRTLNEVLESPEEKFAHAEQAAAEAIMEAAEHAEELKAVTENEEKVGTAKLLAASFRMAMNVIEKKYDDLFGQVGDDFHEMITQLNDEHVFSRTLDAELLRIAHNAIQHNLELPDTDYERIVDEITFIIQG